MNFLEVFVDELEVFVHQRLTSPEHSAPRTTREIKYLVGVFADDPRGDTGRMGIAGPSMGGWTAFCAAAHCPCSAASAPMLVSPGWLWEMAALESSIYPEWKRLWKSWGMRRPSIKKFSRRSTLYPNFWHLPLLMILGDKDPYVPKAQVIESYRDLKPHYRKHPDNLRVRIFDDAAHDVTSEMLRTVKDWFAGHLL